MASLLCPNKGLEWPLVVLNPVTVVGHGLWSQVKNLSELDPITAEAFLLEKCLSLSAKTINTRASALRQWCDALKPAYQEI